MKKDIKSGDLIKVKHDLPITDIKFTTTYPGWTPPMNYLLGKWVHFVSYNEETKVIRIKGERNFAYLNESSIDWDADSKFAENLFLTPNVGDWAVYYEGEEDREIATIGKVTAVIEEDGVKKYTIDGFDGYTIAYHFDGNLEFLEAIRNNNI